VRPYEPPPGSDKILRLYGQSAEYSQTVLLQCSTRDGAERVRARQLLNLSRLSKVAQGQPRQVTGLAPGLGYVAVIEPGLALGSVLFCYLTSRYVTASLAPNFGQ
jgi:hypothetical protein